MIWSRYTHSALYIGNGKIIDSTWQYGVKTRSLSDLLNESNRVGVLRIQGLTSDHENNVLTAALSKESAAYNFESVKLLGEQKLNALANISKFGSGYMIYILSNAEYLTPNTSKIGRAHV